MVTIFQSRLDGAVGFQDPHGGLDRRFVRLVSGWVSSGRRRILRDKALATFNSFAGKSVNPTRSDPMMNSIPRRHFLGSAAATVALAALPSTAADSPPGSKIRIGLIGCGWWGLIDAKAALKSGGVEVVAVCDVDSAHLAAAADEIAKLQGSRPKEFKSHEELLAVEGLQAIIIATPPQWHALPFIAACARGLDIYCEKIQIAFRFCDLGQNLNVLYAFW